MRNIEERQEQLLAIHERIFGKPEPVTADCHKSNGAVNRLSDLELIEKAKW